jgi:transcription elongation factor GreB
MGLERREHRGGKQHVAMMTELCDQYAAHGGKIDGVGDHGQNDSKFQCGPRSELPGRRSGGMMNKAFTRESEGDEDDDDDIAAPLPAGQKNYITPGGHARLMAELDRLVGKERPETAGIVGGRPAMATAPKTATISTAKAPARNRPPDPLPGQASTSKWWTRPARLDQIFFGDQTIAGVRGEQVSIVGTDETTLRAAISAGFHRWRGLCSRRAPAMS